MFAYLLQYRDKLLTMPDSTSKDTWAQQVNYYSRQLIRGHRSPPQLVSVGNFENILDKLETFRMDFVTWDNRALVTADDTFRKKVAAGTPEVGNERRPFLD